MMRKLMLAGLALVTASAAQAGAPAELACIAKGYSPQQRAELDALLPKVDFLKGSEEDAAIQSFSLIVYTSVLGCAQTYKWSEAEQEPAMMHEFGRLIELGFRRHGSFTAAQIGQIDAALAKGDRSELWRALEEQFTIGVEGQEIAVSDRNAEILGAFIIETGLGLSDAVAEQIGVYLAAKVMQRASERSFAALK